MSLLTYLKESLISENDSCPLSLPYGGISGGGGFGHNTEYEVGANLIAEAVHCILGSLYKMKGTDYSSKNIEEEHIREELKIVKNALKEYSNPLYISDWWRVGEDSYETISNIKKVSPKLIMVSQQAKTKLNVPSPYKEVAINSYDVLIALAEAMDKSVRHPRELDSTYPISNAFMDKTLIDSVKKLENSINVMYSGE